MWSTVKELLRSRKALVMFASVIVWIAGRAGLDIDKTELLGAVGPMWGYIFGQSLADIGKEKAKIEAGKVTA